MIYYTPEVDQLPVLHEMRLHEIQLDAEPKSLNQFTARPRGAWPSRRLNFSITPQSAHIHHTASFHRMIRIGLHVLRGAFFLCHHWLPRQEGMTDSIKRCNILF